MMRDHMLSGQSPESLVHFFKCVSSLNDACECIVINVSLYFL